MESLYFSSPPSLPPTISRRTQGDNHLQYELGNFNLGSFADVQAGDGGIAVARKPGNEIKSTGELCVVVEP